MDKMERARRAHLAKIQKKKQRQQRRRSFICILVLTVLIVFIAYKAGFWKQEEEVKTAVTGNHLESGYAQTQSFVSEETVESETVESETMESETVESETVESETEESEIVESETMESETVEEETEEAEIVDEEAIEAEKVAAENLQILESGLTAESALLMRQEEILYAKNTEQKMYPASMTKLMTALVALEYGDPEEMVTVANLNGASCYVEGSVLAYYQEWDQITLKDLLGTMLVFSANDAASAIACHIGGSEEAFAEMMNQYAIEIGAMNTHFTNPHGLHDEEHYTCANDMMLILKAAVNNELVLEILQSEVYYSRFTRGNTMQELSYPTTSKYLNGQYSIDKFNYVAGKTGYTGPAGRCFASCFEKDQEYYYCIVMKSEDYVLATSLLYYYASEPAQMQSILEQQKGG